MSLSEHDESLIAEALRQALQASQRAMECLSSAGLDEDHPLVRLAGMTVVELRTALETLVSMMPLP